MHRKAVKDMETRVQSLGWEDSPGEGKWQPTPVFLPGESHGRRSLMGATVHGVEKGPTQLSNFTLNIHMAF